MFSDLRKPEYECKSYKCDIQHPLKVWLGNDSEMVEERGAASIERNYINSRKSSDTFQCPHCPYVCSTRSHFTKHYRTHTGEKPFSCPYCSYQVWLSNDSEMVSQRAPACTLRSPDGNRKALESFKCTHCSYMFLNIEGQMVDERRAACNRRNQADAMKKQDVYQCRHCTYSTTLRTNYEKHFRTHAGEKQFENIPLEIYGLSCALVLDLLN
ncbi:zinc finger protein 774-like [Penaeus chinensis]|uniref:zinc finger protein 774-like n=1 Tax=Penaeus chinensis TaxID=139456 RepID=UPI001FB6DD8F|nr:zinc finger protein 774-like [Penaeus chinensis]